MPALGPWLAAIRPAVLPDAVTELLAVVAPTVRLLLLVPSLTVPRASFLPLIYGTFFLQVNGLLLTIKVYHKY